jgi:4,5-DOPA dioxygenase extradiol
MKMPVLFVGHGSPMNAIDDNRWSRGFRSLADLLPQTRAILSVSAHWYVAGTFLTGEAQPKTIHDFGGFPQELYEVQYPAPGSVELAQRASKLLDAGVRTDWGLDHGTWSVLVHLRPKADLPVVQLSIDGRLPPEAHVELGKALAPLRDEGVLILGSGNVTHNLRHAFSAYQHGDTSTPAWAEGFDAGVTRALEQHDTAELARLVGTSDGRMAHPSPDHYYPLLYAAGAAGADKVSFPISGFDMGSLSMRSVLFG